VQRHRCAAEAKHLIQHGFNSGRASAYSSSQSGFAIRHKYLLSVPVYATVMKYSYAHATGSLLRRSAPPVRPCPIKHPLMLFGLLGMIRARSEARQAPMCAAVAIPAP
jgi:hypothetical protein